MNKLIDTIIIVLFVSVLQAQETVKNDTIKNYKLDEILIKSPKYNKNIFEIPAAATLVPARAIENNKVETLTDLSGMVPNFFMPDYGSKLTSPVYIRGVGNRINTPSVGLYVDGIPYFEKAAFNFDFFDVERIEVLRGPQGTLYGRNAMGGLINVITQNPGKEKKITMGVDYGNYNQLQTNITYNQPLGKSLSVLASLNQKHNDGFFTNVFNQSRVDKLNSYSGRAKVLFKPSSKFKTTFNAQYEDSRQGGYPYALFNDETMQAANVNYNKKSVYNRKLLSSGVNIQFTAPHFLTRAVTSFQSLNDAQKIDQDFTPQSLFFITQDQQLNMVAQEINIQSRKNKIYDWLFGIFGFRQHLNKQVEVQYGDDAIARYRLPYSEYYYTKHYDNSNTGLAFFHQSTLKLGGFSFTAGIRADYEKATLDYVYDKFKNGVQSNADAFISDMDFFEILPKVAVKYSISDYFVPYATIAKGYNAGGFNSTFEREEDRSFKPEQTWNYEAGIKAKWLQQRIYANLAFFYIDWTNQQIYQTVPSGHGSMLTNAGKSESKGIEFEIKALPAKNLETWLSFGYNDARFVDYVKNKNEDYSGKYLPYVPKFSFNLGGNYKIEIDKFWLDRIRIHLSYNGFGKHYWKETNVAYQDYYGLLNHRISFEKNNIVFSFWGKNILNANYNSFYFQALGNSYAQIGKPASLGVNLKVTF
ncbi:MAG: TonB-dependent receptor [Prolixibacteraceae bacterium]|nr:TonB-dependent receptor [Prolixibacteraceae bacterium]